MSTVHWSDGYIMLPWFVAVHFHILKIPNKDAPGSRQLSTNARVIWLCACVRYWPGTGLVYVCQLPLSSAEASLCCREAMEKEKESAWRTMGRGKREERLPTIPTFHRPPRAVYYYYYYCYFYRDTLREPLRRRECQLLSLLL